MGKHADECQRRGNERQCGDASAKRLAESVQCPRGDTHRQLGGELVVLPSGRSTNRLLEFDELFEFAGDLLDELGVECVDADDLSEAFASLDYTDIDPSAISGFVDIDLSEWSEQAIEATSADDLDVIGDSALYLADLPAAVNAAIAAGTHGLFDDAVTQLVSGYPPELLGNGVAINFELAISPEYPTAMGLYRSDGLIELFDHVESLDMTLHHEIGHHLFAHNPDMLSDVWTAVQDSEFFVDQHSFLELYEPSQIPEEACAEAVASFKSNPPTFAARYPELIPVMQNWLGGSS